MGHKFYGSKRTDWFLSLIVTSDNCHKYYTSQLTWRFKANWLNLISNLELVNAKKSSSNILIKLQWIQLITLGIVECDENAVEIKNRNKGRNLPNFDDKFTSWALNKNLKNDYSEVLVILHFQMAINL